MATYVKIFSTPIISKDDYTTNFWKKTVADSVNFELLESQAEQFIDYICSNYLTSHVVNFQQLDFADLEPAEQQALKVAVCLRLDFTINNKDVFSKDKTKNITLGDLSISNISNANYSDPDSLANQEIIRTLGVTRFLNYYTGF